MGLRRTMSARLCEFDGRNGPFPIVALDRDSQPCISSSHQTLSTVPVFPSVRITALPTSSVWACSNSPRIVDARTFAVGMGPRVKRSNFSEDCAKLHRAPKAPAVPESKRNVEETPRFQRVQTKSCGRAHSFKLLTRNLFRQGFSGRIPRS